MSRATQPSTASGNASGTAEQISASFARLVPLAIKGLKGMLLPDGHVFCFKALPSGPAQLVQEGISERYSAMTGVGMLLQERLGVATGIETGAMWDHLARWAADCHEAGDAALVLWGLCLRGDSRAADLAATLLRRRDEVLKESAGFSSMESGFLLIGLSEAVRSGAAMSALKPFASAVAAELAGNQDRATHLFSFGRRRFRKNLHQGRITSRLGSFASQVYPTMGFSAWSRASGDDVARGIAIRCANRIVELQGSAGQWWWVYHARRGVPVVRHPVYSVHQEAMGPMMLLAAALCDGKTDRYDSSILRSLQWLDQHPECPDIDMWDPGRGVVWRALQRDDPAVTSNLGLGKGELARVGRAAWLGREDRRDFSAGHLCKECRPYELGWILLADAMFRERCARGG